MRPKLAVLDLRSYSKDVTVDQARYFTDLVRSSTLKAARGLEVMLTDSKAIRRGFGVEAGKLISYYGVDVLGLRRIEAKVYEYNRLSANSLRRNGFQQEGLLRKAGYQDGRYWDVLVFGILKDEIDEQRRKDKPYLPLADAEWDALDAS